MQQAVGMAVYLARADRLIDEHSSISSLGVAIVVIKVSVLFTGFFGTSATGEFTQVLVLLIAASIPEVFMCG